MADLDRRRFLSSGPLLGLGSLAACRSTFRRELLTINADASPERLAEEYTLEPGLVYLNHGSIGTIPRRVQQARAAYLATCEQNPWLYMWGGAWEQAREDTRAAAARVLGSAPEDVAITHNTTEGFNVLARGLPLGRGDEVLFSSLNHAGASACFEHAAQTRGFTVRKFPLPLEEAATLSIDDVVALHTEAISDDTRVLVLPHIDNMIGLRHPIAAIAKAAKARGVGYVFVDAAQTVGMIPVDFAASGIDALCASPHKWLQAPKGLGLFCTTPDLREVLRPFWVTWGQQRWADTVRVFEDYGTRNMPEVLALGDAIAFRERLGIAAGAAKLRQRREAVMARVDATPGLRFRSPRDWALGGSLVAVQVEGKAAPALAQQLFERHRVIVRGFGGEFDSLRISPNIATTDDDIDRLFAGLG